MFSRLIIIVGIITLIVGGAFIVYKKKVSNSPVACTMEAMQCPDGSYVGRTGPKCEFSQCPTVKPTEQYTGVLLGEITLSPTCPVERIPPDPGCSPKPFSTLLDVFARNQLFLQVHTDVNGKFFMHLPEGDYEVSPNVSGPYPRCESKKIIISKNATTTLNISCDTGIR